MDLRVPSSITTWKSYVFHKVCACPIQLQTKIDAKNLNKNIRSINDQKKPIQSHNDSKVHAPCGCLKRQLTSVIDNAYLSLSEKADLQVSEDSISDHFPILVSLATKMEPKEKTKTI